MPKIAYIDRQFRAKALARIEQANDIIREYYVAGFTLTLRQLYYQFVARDIIPNEAMEYHKLGNLISAARKAGLIDWDAIVDRTRAPHSLGHWDSPATIVAACADQFRVNLWEGQDVVPEVWIEKDALVGVIEPVCERHDATFFSCRGYPSDSSVWRAANRIHERFEATGQKTLILHLGDHDPSGVDMSRDIEERLNLFTYDGVWSGEFEVRRIALTMKQVKRYKPPPNPTKLTDARAGGYIAKHGYDSWELDALEPQVMDDLITKHIDGMRNDGLWAIQEARMKAGRHRLQGVVDLLEAEAEEDDT